ncbi:MAG: Zn-dependent alcohol dehydrogenase [Rhodospirillales bacterium]|nr:Zn-dependent alcohol dehydrogenase [Rhodospirillales bacterium]
MKFRAAVLRQVGQPLAIETVEAAALKPTDVLVRIRASGLCHTDLEVIEGALPYPLPIVLGHEGAGVVEAVGSAVRQVKPGDHVVCSWNPHCGDCFYCDRDQPILCEVFSATQPKGQLMDGTSRLACDDGAPMHHFSVVSSHAEYCVVPESGAIAVPKAIPFDRACLIGCGVMTGFGAATRAAPVPAGANVLVIGCGAVGLNVLQGARLAGAGRIVAIDRSQARLELARRFGATDGLLAGDAALGDVRALTQGRGADLVFESAGHPSAFALAAEACRPGGQVVFLGKVHVDQQIAFRWGSLMGEKRITRSSYGGARPRRDFPLLAQAYLDGRLNLDDLITARLPLDRINDGFDAMRRGEGIRSVITFD